MKNLIRQDGELQQVIQEFYEFKNPKYDPERGFRLNETLFVK